MFFDDLNNQISFHDAYVSDYKKINNNFSFVVKDGWKEDTYYKFEFVNVKIAIMNNKSTLIDYVVNTFNNINNNSALIFAGELGEFNGGQYLKLWIDYPSNIGNINGGSENMFIFGDISFEFCNDYDDTGRLYIKFLADKINVLNLY